MSTRLAPPPAVESLPAGQRLRRERIVDAAVKLMGEHDYERIQVKDVADEAGVALGTLYRYFNSKDHLFAAALQSWAEGFGESLTRRSPTGPPADRVKAIYRRAVRAFERQPGMYAVMFALQATTEPYASELYRSFSEGTQRAFAGAIRDAPPERRADVVDVMGAVLDVNLRQWRLGHRSIAEVYEAVNRAVDLIFPA